MITEIIKLDGRVVPFDPDKVNGWAEWAAQHLGGFVDWAGVAMRAVAKLPNLCSSQDLQLALIQECLDQKTWAYYRMAARLYVPLLRKKMYNTDSALPKVRDVQREMVEWSLMRDLDYTDAEWAEVDEIIQHKRDMNYAYFQIKQIVEKYSLHDRRKDSESDILGRYFEMPQYVYMRMALALSEDEPHAMRMHHVKKYYDHFSNNRLNAPTPNFTNLGTTHNGYASCCLYVTNDTEKSLGIGDHIARTMTVASAGIGGAIICRSIGDPVRDGLIIHQGKVPYYNALAGAVNSSTQNGRGGACTTYFSIYDPEVVTLMNLRHPKSPEDKKILTMDFAVCLHKHIVRKACDNEDIFLFNTKTAPDLVRAFYSPEPGLFEAMYNSYEANPKFKKNYVSARNLLVSAVNISIETGSLYLFFADEANRHTPFYDTIHSSNLCVAPETMLRTQDGEFAIGSLQDRSVKVWNGQQWSKVTVRKTGTDRKLLKVFVSDDRILECTKEHKWYVEQSDGSVVETMTAHLSPGDHLEAWTDADGVEHKDYVVSIHDNGRISDTFCVTEPLRHRVVFNGVLTGNCAEIFEPTAPYMEMMDLYQAEAAGWVILKAKLHDGSDDDTLYDFDFDAPERVSLLFSKRPAKAAQELVVGDVFTDDRHTPGTNSATAFEVVDIIECKPEPEVALCSLAAIVPSYIESDEQYAEVAYYALKMIDKCIHMSDFPLAHIGYTARQRLSAGVGLTGVAHYMAKKRLKYSTLEGKQELHRLSERHAFHVISASLRLGKELGNAPWIHRTKWPEGWLPIDTYERRVDTIAEFKLEQDWETLRAGIIANGGIRNSCVIAHMPTESSSKASGIPNGFYPIRDYALGKTDNNLKLDWAPTDGDKLKRFYEIAWDIPYVDMIHNYAIAQKFTDQGGSWDQWVRLEGDSQVYSDVLLDTIVLMATFGVKSRYYFNSKTSQTVVDERTGEAHVVEITVEHNVSDKCVSGGCDA